MAFGIQGIHTKMMKIKRVPLAAENSKLNRLDMTRKIEFISWFFSLPLEVGPQNRGTEGHLKFFSKFTFLPVCFFNSYCAISYFYIFKPKMHRHNVKKDVQIPIFGFHVLE